ncbi:MAG: calcium/sodium antiporter [Candidatus Omnitrophica bacterium]|nr:calcium/sodium antiporter [Candidatus Omnitrophota bacterium]MBD3268772.1 calcium/sodium antiporter [Candidatus Omnitrophota bacterium]
MITQLILPLTIFSIGLALLIFSSEWLIQFCVKLSKIFMLSPLFVGLVLIAFGTSAPEAGVGIIAALEDHKSIALGNVVGSNIANIALILGLCALVNPLKVERSIFKREFPVMLFSAGLLYLLSLDLLLSRLDGIIFLLCLLFFLWLSYKGSKDISSVDNLEDFRYKKLVTRINSRPLLSILIALSIAGVVAGADLMVKGGVGLARVFEVKPWVVAVTVFAIGTSLPELSASMAASFKKMPSIGIGNVVGSNIFNILFVIGVVSLIRPIEVNPSIMTFEMPVMLIFSLVIFIIMLTGHKISRCEGGALFLAYVVFIFMLFKG